MDNLSRKFKSKKWYKSFVNIFLIINIYYEALNWVSFIESLKEETKVFYTILRLVLKNY